jgi:hypothetical protein
MCNKIQRLCNSEWGEIQERLILRPDRKTEFISFLQTT